MGPFKSRWNKYIQRSYQVVREEGFRALVRKAGPILREFALPRSYKRWMSRYDSLNYATRQKITVANAKLRTRPTFSIIMPVCGGAEQWFTSTLKSVEAQLYPHWELCLGVVASVPDQPREKLHALERRHNRIRIARVEDTATWAEKANGAL